MAAPNYIFKRVVIINMESATWRTTFDGNTFHIRFEVPFDSDTTPNEVTLQIYNLTDQTVKRFTKNMNVTIQAGYEGNYGVLSRGKIQTARTYREGADRITEIKIIDGRDTSGKTLKKNETFKAGSKGDVILRRIAEEMLGIRIAEMKLPTNKEFKKGYVVSGSPMSHLVSVAKECGASVFWKRGLLCIRSLKEKVNEKMYLSEGTGLIGSPEFFEEDGVKGYRFKSLLQHKAIPGTLVEFKSRTSNGQYRLRKGKHINNGSEFITEGEVI